MSATLFLFKLILVLSAVKEEDAGGNLQKIFAGSTPDTTRINSDLCQKWRLTEVRGKSIPGMAKIPFLQLNASFQADGFSGCNRFFGTYSLGDNHRITFSDIRMTQMACIQENTVEADFMVALSSADGYVLRNDTLLLIKARMAPLARLVAMRATPLKKKK